MKKSLILLGLLGLQQAFAQTGKVGINTDNPSATLNVKSKTGTTNTTKNLELENASGTKLVTVLDDGKVGIGTTSPSTKLEVNATSAGQGFKLVDSSQGDKKVLTSDANGNASWKPIALPIIRGNIGAGVNIPYTTKNYLYTGSSITLPANSKWQVSAIQLLVLERYERNKGVLWVRTSFSDSPTTTTPSNDIQGSNLISGLLPTGAAYNILSGSVIIYNKSNSPKTYYYIGGNVDFYNTTQSLSNFGGKWAENSISAIQITD